MTDAIESAYLRLKWAKKHIDEFNTRVKAFADTSPQDMVEELDDKTGNCFLRLIYKKPLPPELGLAAGDALHSLRATLDGLFWALAQQHGIKKDVSFPVRKSPEGFKDTRHKLRPIPSNIFDTLEDFQPYKRGQILRVVHDLDIINKHSAILLTASVPTEVTFGIDVPIEPMLCVGVAEDGAVIAKIRFPTLQMTKAGLNTSMSFQIAFNEAGDAHGEHVWDVLMIAHDFIRDEIITVFKKWLTS